MKLHEKLGHWTKRILDQLLIWSLPWKTGTILIRDDQIFVVLEIELAPKVEPPSALMRRWLFLIDRDSEYYRVKMVRDDGKIVIYTFSEAEIFNSLTQRERQFWKVVSND